MVQSKPTVGILGYGFVGQATAQLQSAATVSIYDPYVEEHKSAENAIKVFHSDFVICCVPTPEGDDGHVDLSILEDCVQNWIAYKDCCEFFGVFVIKSTIPAGTVDRLCAEHGTDRIIHNPEFLTERTHLEDFRNPTDIVIGGAKEHCEGLADLYRLYFQDHFGFSAAAIVDMIDINLCSAKEAELVKTVRNSFYATKVIFMNEIYLFCEKLGINYEEYEKVLTNNGAHSWWGPEHSKVPGPDGKLGFGGKCFPKDSMGLYSLAKNLGVELEVLKAAIDKNTKLRPLK